MQPLLRRGGGGAQFLCGTRIAGSVTLVLMDGIKSLNTAPFPVASEHVRGIGAWEYDLRTQELTWTEGVYTLFGLPPGIRLDRAGIVEMYHEESRIQMEALRAHLLQCGGAFTLDARIWTADGVSRWMRLNAGLSLRDGEPVRLFGTKQDITEERAALARLRERAEFDAVTLLPNRASFESRWQGLERGEAPECTAFGLIDLDRFKQVNDRWGHAAGDECLRVVADRLRRALRRFAFLARYGRDEFAFLWCGPSDPAFLRAHLRRVGAQLAEPVGWNGGLIPITVSIGLALRAPGGSARDLFRRADEALYRAKSGDRLRPCLP